MIERQVEMLILEKQIEVLRLIIQGIQNGNELEVVLQLVTDLEQRTLNVLKQEEDGENAD